MEFTKPLRLGEVLSQEGLIQRDQLAEALEEQKLSKRRLGEVLVGKGWIMEEKMTQTLANIYQLPFVRLSETKKDDKVVSLIPYDLLQTYKVFPISLNNQYLMIATNDPLDVSALQEIQYKSGYLLNPVMASLTDINSHIKEHIDSLSPSKRTTTATSTPIASAGPVIQLVDSLLRRAIKENASDIHLEPRLNKMYVRYRIDGVLYERTSIPKELERNVISRIKIVAGMDVAESRRPQDGRFSFVNEQEEYDIRISTLRNLVGENLVLRILHKQFVSRNFSGLGMDDREAGIVSKLLNRPYGLLVVTGPTGAGKTTTLYSMLNQLNNTARSIVTVEDPVEYELEGINQTPITNMIGYTFATAIRHILRHDPDVIMVGEIRDAETAETAIRAALTGHLVLTTMHTNSAAGAINRLLEMKIEPFLIASAISGVISQRLIRTLCSHCKKDFTPSDEMIKTVSSHVPLKKSVQFASKVGCEHCLKAGYQGRSGIFEILNVNDEIRAQILKSASEQEIIKMAIDQGMNTLAKAALTKVAQKETSLEEALRVAIIE